MTISDLLTKIKFNEVSIMMEVENAIEYEKLKMEVIYFFESMYNSKVNSSTVIESKTVFEINNEKLLYTINRETHFIMLANNKLFFV